MSANPTNTTSAPVGPWRTRARRTARQIERALAIAGALLIVYHLGFGWSEVTSNSMAPTLNGDGRGAATNDWVLYETISPRLCGPPPRQHLIVFRNEEGTSIVKRLVAFGGEAVAIEEGQLDVDGRRLALPEGVSGYLRAGHLRPTPEGSQRYTVPAGNVFVLGDHTRDSWDGRFFGGLEEERVEGRVVAVLWPPSRARWLW